MKTKLGELRKLAIADTFGALLVTLKTAVLQGLPPLPVELVKSTTSGSHDPEKRQYYVNTYTSLSFFKRLPIVAGIASTTEGITGITGRETRIAVAGTNFQFKHAAWAAGGHCALMTFARRVTWLPTETVPKEPGKTARVLGSLGHWQEAERTPAN